MKQLSEYYQLGEMNTFGVEVIARYFCQARSEYDIVTIAKFAKQQNKLLIPLGHGSNIIFHQQIDAVVMSVLLNNLSIDHYTKYIYLTVGAGINWHFLVRWTLKQGFYGLENLSLIPGTTGATPIQNIGAYGVEIKDFLIKVKGYQLSCEKFITLSQHDCQLGYRNSIFKNDLQHDFIITEITLKLSKQLVPNLQYENLFAMTQKISLGNKVTGLNISDAVCAIRGNKLPDPKIIGNAGSFFKNPVITDEHYQSIRSLYPNIIANNEYDKWKISAAWLIENCGFKGYRKKNIGIYPTQSLVICNYSPYKKNNHGQSKVTAEEIIKFANNIQKKVLEKFQISLDIEPIIY